MTPEGTTVILIRHAERLATPGNDDPHLSAAGKSRARLLLHVLSKAKISAIYTSKKIRTNETAQPLAGALGLSPIKAPEALDIKKDILLNHPGKTVLVVGHTDTVPEVIRLLGDNGHQIDDREFDNMFVATVLGESKVRITRLKYGART
jgi:2,3-bisphosphoglycerate-dependent phosphoglycerate mutase